jgi:hypothetical protein
MEYEKHVQLSGLPEMAEIETTNLSDGSAVHARLCDVPAEI